MKGKGQPGQQGAPAGDLYVVVHVSRDPRFSRKGRNLTSRVPISFTEAALGADVTVETLDGTVTMRVPPGTSRGHDAAPSRARRARPRQRRRRATCWSPST